MRLTRNAGRHELKNLANEQTACSLIAVVAETMHRNEMTLILADERPVAFVICVLL